MTTGKVFKLPRLTNISPLVSAHNKPASKCTKHVCFDGHTKSEVFKSIKHAFLTHKDKLESDLENIGIESPTVILTGSVVRGGFGCRDFEKIKGEIDPLIQEVWLDVGLEEDLINKVENALLESKSTFEFWTKINQSISSNTDDTKLLMEDIRISVCSDIDIMTVTDTNVGFTKKREADRLISKATKKMDEETKGDMVYLHNFTNTDYAPNDEVISSERGFNKIIRRFY